jgi:hypothetical protein
MAEEIEGRIANIFFIFSQAENHVKEMVAERTVLHRKDYLYHATFETSILTILCFRGFERPAANAPAPPDYDVKVHQKLVHAFDHS